MSVPSVSVNYASNCAVLNRIYIGRRFKNDVERLEKLFDLYTKMTSTEAKLGAKGVLAS
ncbi:MAG: hypothetical protein JKY17_03780 [Magnetovibrio sp.]|nr:hypothetical protein [Magnetovibrio sp.]